MARTAKRDSRQIEMNSFICFFQRQSGAEDGSGHARVPRPALPGPGITVAQCRAKTYYRSGTTADASVMNTPAAPCLCDDELQPTLCAPEPSRVRPILWGPPSHYIQNAALSHMSNSCACPRSDLLETRTRGGIEGNEQLQGRKMQHGMQGAWQRCRMFPGAVHQVDDMRDGLAPWQASQGGHVASDSQVSDCAKISSRVAANDLDSCRPNRDAKLTTGPHRNAVRWRNRSDHNTTAPRAVSAAS